MENHAPIGKMMAFETRYDVRTQVASSVVAERLPAMCGRATFATLVSSTSMKVASMTVAAITQGLTSGRAGSTALFCVERLHLTGAAGQIGARLIVAI